MYAELWSPRWCCCCDAQLPEGFQPTPTSTYTHTHTHTHTHPNAIKLNFKITKPRTGHAHNSQEVVHMVISFLGNEHMLCWAAQQTASTSLLQPQLPCIIHSHLTRGNHCLNSLFNHTFLHIRIEGQIREPQDQPHRLPLLFTLLFPVYLCFLSFFSFLCSVLCNYFSS